MHNLLPVDNFSLQQSRVRHAAKSPKEATAGLHGMTAELAACCSYHESCSVVYPVRLIVSGEPALAKLHALMDSSGSAKEKSPQQLLRAFLFLVRLAGIEPTTPWFVAKYSIQLSYSR